MKNDPQSTLTRRDFLTASGAACVLAATGGVRRAAGMGAAPPPAEPHDRLPYAYNALEPVISARTLSFHRDQHHRGYANNLANLIRGTDWEEARLEDIVLATVDQPDQTAIFNNAAQVWNHEFYWKSLSPTGGGPLPAPLKSRIENSFGDVHTCLQELGEAAKTQFASGWAWLVANEDKIEIRQTSNAHTPLTEQGVTPLLTIDVWEHAYYLDWQNRRGDHVDAVLDRLVHWEFAAQNLAAAETAAAGVAE